MKTIISTRFHLFFLKMKVSSPEGLLQFFISTVLLRSSGSVNTNRYLSGLNIFQERQKKIFFWYTIVEPARPALCG